MTVYPRNDSQFYHYDFQYRGRRYHGSTYKRDARSAAKFERSMRQKAEASVAFVSLPDAPTSLARALHLFVKLQVPKMGGKQKVRQDRVSQLTRIVDALNPASHVGDLSSKILATYVEKRINESHSQRKSSTINGDLSLLRRLLIFCSEIIEIKVKEIAWKSLMLKVHQIPVRVISKEEEARIAKVQDPVDSAIREVAISTALRIGDVLGLRWDQIDWEERTATVIQKGGEPHVAALTDRLISIIARQKGRHQDFVFAYQITCAKQYIPCKKTYYIRGDYIPVTSDANYKRWCKALEAAGVIHTRRHAMRSTAATRCFRKGKDTLVVQKLLGHQSLKYTTRYLQLSPDDVRDVMVMVEQAA